jgi:hypothetical protein
MECSAYQKGNNMQYWKEILIIVLVFTTVAAIAMSDKYRSETAATKAGTVRMQNISSATAGRPAITDREKYLYPEIDKGIAVNESKRAKIKIEGKKPVPTRKETDSEIQKTTKGDINALAHLFVLSGYPCSVR